MVVQPFDYQKRTNIEEHNQIVDKLNEVVDAVNNMDPSGQGLEPRVTALETDVTDLGERVDSVESKNLQQDTAITDIRADAETTKNRLGTAEGNIATLTGKVTQLETDTTDLDGRLTTLAGNYTALGGRVDTLNTEVGQLTTKTTSLETGKVNVAQGVANAGKVLGIGADGNVTPVEQSGGGGSAFPYIETITDLNPGELLNKVKKGDELILNTMIVIAGSIGITNPSLQTRGDFKTIEGSLYSGQGQTAKTIKLLVSAVSSSLINFCEVPVYENITEFYETVGDVQIAKNSCIRTFCPYMSDSQIACVSYCSAVLYAQNNTTVIPRTYYHKSQKNITSLTGYIVHNS